MSRIMWSAGLAVVGAAACLPRTPSGSSGNKGTGLVVSPREGALTQVVPPNFGAGDRLPQAVDLAEWLPPARDQGLQNACVGFALGYGLKTYHEARENGWDVSREAHQFSPSYIFKRVNLGCSIGASIKDGLDMLVNDGCLTVDVAPYDPESCAESPDDTMPVPAISSRIRSYKLIAAYDLNTVKSVLAAEVPVVLGIKAYDQWFALQGRQATYDLPSGASRNHVVLAVGYDDGRRAVKVFNSYGPGWGDDGFGWIHYDIWNEVALIAYIAEDEEQAPLLRFRAPLDHLVGESPSAIAAGDLDGDADVDLIVANTGSHDLTLLVNDGRAGFEAQTINAAGVFPESVLFGDLDGDFDLDVVVGNAGTDQIAVWSNEGGGMLSAPITYEVGNSPVAMVLGDVDGVLGPDLVVANSLSDEVSVLLNRGDGTFDARVDYAVDDFPASVSLGDLDADDDLDLVVVTSGLGPLTEGGGVTVLFNDGQGGFGGHTVYGVGSLPRFASVADLDDDNDLDVIVANVGSDDVSTLINDGSGLFAPAVQMASGGDIPVAVLVTDLDADGGRDLAVINKGSDDISVMLHGGPGKFQSPLRFGAGLRPAAAAVADLNGDGLLDLAVCNGQSNDVSILVNEPLADGR